LNLLGYYYHYTSYLSSSFKGDFHFNEKSSFNNENSYNDSRTDDKDRSYHTSTNSNASSSSNLCINKFSLPFNFNKRRLYSTSSIIQQKSMYFEHSLFI
jgi:hypothetical protein